MTTSPFRPRGLQGEYFQKALAELNKLAQEPASQPAMRTFGPVPQLETVPDDVEKLASQLEKLAGRGSTTGAEGLSVGDLAAELEKAAAHADTGQQVVEKVAMLLVGLEAQEQVLQELQT